MTAPSVARGRRVTRGDDVLLHAIADGDLGALGELYDRHARSMWRAIERTLGAQADVDDVVHAVFLKLPKIARSYDGRPDAHAWLVGIAVRVALSHRRGVRRFLRMLSSLSEVELERPASNPEMRASGREELATFEAAFAKLSPEKRAVFALIEFEGCSAEEAARALGVPPSTIRTRLHYARRKLHAAILNLRGE